MLGRQSGGGITPEIVVKFMLLLENLLLLMDGRNDQHDIMTKHTKNKGKIEKNYEKRTEKRAKPLENLSLFEYSS